jgi:hypothetical protein
MSMGPCHSSGGYSPASQPRRPRFEPRSGHVGFVVDKVKLGQVFSECFGFPCQFSFHRLLHAHHLSSGADTIGQLVADVPSGLSLTPLQKTKKSTHEYQSNRERGNRESAVSCSIWRFHDDEYSDDVSTWHDTSSLVDRLQCFGETCYLSLQEKWLSFQSPGSHWMSQEFQSQTSLHYITYNFLYSDYLFSSEYRGSMFPQNDLSLYRRP